MRILECKCCFKEIAKYENEKEIPKRISCPHCHTKQDTTVAQSIGFSHKRNYPSGYFENQ